MGESGMTPQSLAVADRDFEGALFSHDDDEAFSAGDRGVEQIALQHGEMLGRERNDDGGKFATLGFMDRHGVGEGEFVELARLVVDPRMSFEAHVDRGRFGRDLSDVSDVAVEDLLVIVVADLDDLVAGAKGGAETLDLELRIARGVERVLQTGIELPRAEAVPVHRRQHLDAIAGVPTEAPGDAFGDEVLDRLGDRLGPLAGEKEKVGVGGIVEWRDVTFVHLVGGLDDAALGRLPIDMGEPSDRHDSARDQIGEEIARSHGGELVRVADEEDVAMSGDRLEKGGHQAQIDHRGLVDDEEISRERAMAIAGKSHDRLILERAMQGEGLAPRALGEAFRRASRRGAEHRIHFLGGENFDKGAQDRCLADSGTSREDEKTFFRRAEDRVRLFVREPQRMMPLKPCDRCLRIERRQGRGRLKEPRDPARDRLLRLMEVGRKDEHLLAVAFHDDAAVEDELIQRHLKTLGFDFEKTCCFLEERGTGEGAVPLALRLFEGVENPCGEASGRLGRLAHLAGDVVRGFEADPRDIAGEPVGIGAKDVHRFLTVGFEKSQGPRRGEAVEVEENHDVAHRLLPFPGILDAEPARFADSRDFLEPLRFFLDDAEGIVAEGRDDALGVGRTDTVDESAREEADDALGRVGRLGGDAGRVELAAETAVALPRSRGLDLLPGNRRW